jgi:hypothetical protein
LFCSPSCQYLVTHTATGGRDALMCARATVISEPSRPPPTTTTDLPARLIAYSRSKSRRCRLARHTLRADELGYWRTVRKVDTRSRQSSGTATPTSSSVLGRPPVASSTCPAAGQPLPHENRGDRQCLLVADAAPVRQRDLLAVDVHALAERGSG